jgi:hypothetical protein
MPRLAGYSLLVSSLLTLTARADAPGAGSISFRGFGTLGVVRNSADQAELVRDVSQPGGAGNGAWRGTVDSLVGAQLNAQLGEDLEGVFQVVSKYGPDRSYRPEVAWAFLKYAPAPGFTLRGGRLGFDVYQLSDTRNIGYSYLWVRPPVEFYGPLPLSRLDGVDLTVAWDLGPGTAKLKLFGGFANEKVPAGVGQFFDLGGSPLLGGNLEYQVPGWTFHVAYATLSPHRELSPQVAELLDALGSPELAAISPDARAAAARMKVKDRLNQYLSFGIGFDQGPFQATFMASHFTSRSETLPAYRSGYLTLGYRFGRLTPFLTGSAIQTRSNRVDPGLADVPAFADLRTGVAELLALGQARQTDLGLGLRWDLRHNLDLKAQIDRVRNRDTTLMLWQNGKPTWNGDATVVSLALDFIF